jgi:hypothetical protein
MPRTPGRYPAQVIIADQVIDLSSIVDNIDNIENAPTSLVFNRQDQLNQPVEVNIKEMFESVLTQTSNSPFTKTKVGLEANAKVTIAAEKFAVFSKAFNGQITPELAQSVVTLTSSGTVATVTTTLAHGYYKGDTVTIAGATPSSYNGSILVTSTPSPTVFTYTVTLGITSPATGTITAQSNQHGLLEMSDDAGYSFGSSQLPYRTVIIRPFAGENVIQNPELWTIFPFAGAETDAAIRYGLGEQFGYSIMVTAFPNPDTGRSRVLKGQTSLLT